jgi:large-conductance mechanosensitive channel
VSSQILAATQGTPAGAIIQWGFLTITVANFIVIVTMIVVFVLALVLPFPGSDDNDRS